MKKYLLFVFCSMLFFLYPEIVRCESGEDITIKSIKRFPVKDYIFNEHEDLINTRYNTKFYGNESEDDNVVFSVKVENMGLVSYSVYLFYKSGTDKELQKKVVDVAAPEKEKETIRVLLTYEELKEKGYPDFWWIEVRDVSGNKVYDEGGAKNYKVIKERLKLITKKE